MANTTFSGPVISTNGFQSGSTTTTALVFGAGTTTSRVAMGTTAANLVGLFGETTATSGDSRTINARLYFSGAGGSGEVLRAFGIVNGVTAATGGTVNGAHISLDVNGASGAVSGAGNAIRATLGGTAVTPGGTLAVVNLDSNFATGVTLPGTAAFLRVTDTNTTKIGNFLNIPAPSNGTIFATHTTQTMTHSIRIVSAAGTNYYVMCTDAATNRG